VVILVILAILVILVMQQRLVVIQVTLVMKRRLVVTLLTLVTKPSQVHTQSTFTLPTTVPINQTVPNRKDNGENNNGDLMQRISNDLTQGPSSAPMGHPRGPRDHLRLHSGPTDRPATVTLSDGSYRRNTSGRGCRGNRMILIRKVGH